VRARNSVSRKSELLRTNAEPLTERGEARYDQADLDDGEADLIPRAGSRGSARWRASRIFPNASDSDATVIKSAIRDAWIESHANAARCGKNAAPSWVAESAFL
jgi:hypothetical protein